jgi:hypothetical protein
MMRFVWINPHLCDEIKVAIPFEQILHHYSRTISLQIYLSRYAWGD